MRRALLSLLLLLGTATAARSQIPTAGYIEWGNNLVAGGIRSPIFGPDPANPYSSITGQPTGLNSQVFPAGNNVYPGPLLQGSGYTFAIFGGPTSASSNILTLLASTTFRTASANMLPAGLTVFGTTTIPGTTAGQPGLFQIRVWDNHGGTLNNWASAEQEWLSGQTAAGVSPVVTSAPLGGTDSNGNPWVTPADSGWVSFNIYYIPEPAMLWVGIVSAVCIFWRARRR